MRSETPLLDRYREMGLTSEMMPEGRIEVAPKEKITHEIREEIRRVKPFIMSELGRRPNWWVVTTRGETVVPVEPWRE
jgi:hypothetical protein